MVRSLLSSRFICYPEGTDEDCSRRTATNEEAEGWARPKAPTLNPAKDKFGAKHALSVALIPRGEGTDCQIGVFVQSSSRSILRNTYHLVRDLKFEHSELLKYAFKISHEPLLPSRRKANDTLSRRTGWSFSVASRQGFLTLLLGCCSERFHEFRLCSSIRTSQRASTFHLHSTVFKILKRIAVRTGESFQRNPTNSRSFNGEQTILVGLQRRFSFTFHQDHDQ